MSRTAHGLSKGEDKRSGNEKNAQHLQKVRYRGGSFERVRGIGVEEPATVGTEHLDRDLRGHGPQREGLHAAFERRDVAHGRERLHDALSDENERENEAQGQKHVQKRPDKIGPEISDPGRLAAGDAADDGHAGGHAHCRRDEVLIGQPDHLGENAHGRLAGVGLPVGVGDEADRRIEGQVPRQGLQPPGIEREDALEKENGKREREAGRGEGGQADGIALPRMVQFRVDPGEGVDPFFETFENGMQDRPAAFQNSKDEMPEGRAAKGQNAEKKPELDEICRCHDICLL
jgi:hypothetical protein